MNLFVDAFAWLFSPDRLTGTNTLPEMVGQQLFYTFVSVLIAAVIAIPAGWVIGHSGRGREIAVAVSGAARAVPSFGLLILLVLLLGVTRRPEAAFITFVILAIPSLLAGAYTGIEAVDRKVIDAARAVGMTPAQVFWRVEVRLGLPLLIGGVRAATLQVVATVTIAAYINLGGLGLPIIAGLELRRFDQVLGAAIAVAALAFLLDAIFAIAQRAVVPRGVRSVEAKPARRRRAAAMQPAT